MITPCTMRRRRYRCCARNAYLIIIFARVCDHLRPYRGGEQKQRVARDLIVVVDLIWLIVVIDSVPRVPAVPARPICSPQRPPSSYARNRHPPREDCSSIVITVWAASGLSTAVSSRVLILFHLHTTVPRLVCFPSLTTTLPSRYPSPYCIL
jgi:hypothetical protein